MKKVTFLPAAHADMSEAMRFYDSHSRSLGDEFLHEIERTVESICAFTTAGRQIAPGIRRRILRRFPFAILYSIEADSITVLAVMHLRRQPDYWKERE